MAIFFWKKNKVIDAFATKLADEFYSEVLPDMMSEYQAARNDKKGKKTAKVAKVVDRKLREVASEIQQFRAENKLGVYGKARLHLTFTDRLEELGYKQNLAKKINEIILLKTP